MKKQKKTLPEWQEEELKERSAQIRSVQEEKERQRRAEEDKKIYGYAILKDGKEQHRTPHLQEALNLARSINGKVWWTIDGDLISEVPLTN